MPDALIRQEYLCDFSAALVARVWGDLSRAAGEGGAARELRHDTLRALFELGHRDRRQRRSLWVWKINRAKGLLTRSRRRLRRSLLQQRAPPVALPRTGSRTRAEARVALQDAITCRTTAGHGHLPPESLPRNLFRERYPGKVQIGPSLSLADGIQAGRWLLQQNVSSTPSALQGIESLRQYHYEVFGRFPSLYSSKPSMTGVLTTRTHSDMRLRGAARRVDHPAGSTPATAHARRGGARGPWTGCLSSTKKTTKTRETAYEQGTQSVVACVLTSR